MGKRLHTVDLHRFTLLWSYLLWTPLKILPTRYCLSQNFQEINQVQKIVAFQKNNPCMIYHGVFFTVCKFIPRLFECLFEQAQKQRGYYWKSLLICVPYLLHFQPHSLSMNIKMKDCVCS